MDKLQFLVLIYEYKSRANKIEEIKQRLVEVLPNRKQYFSEKMPYPCYSVLQGSAEALIRWDDEMRHFWLPAFSEFCQKLLESNNASASYNGGWLLEQSCGFCFRVDWYSVSLGTLYLTPRLSLPLLTNTLPGPIASEVTTLWRYTNLFIIIFLNLGSSSRGGRQKIILEIIALMVNHPSGSHQQSSRAAG